uniref:Uncharacterized protein n=1 Tax=Romanomermis culicivorax TaxID=13658 RepID=A0A915HHB5_ROMCU
MQRMVIPRLLALVICVKVTTGESICFGSLCEDMLYNIKMHTNVDSDISTRGIKNQCPESKNFLLKFVQPYDVRWFDVGIAVNIYNPDCKSFMIRNSTENILVDTDYACSNTYFFLFREQPGSIACRYVFYVYVLFAINTIHASGNIIFEPLNNSSRYGNMNFIVNSTQIWCFYSISKMNVGAGNTANPCEYYKYENGYKCYCTQAQDQQFLCLELFRSCFTNFCHFIKVNQVSYYLGCKKHPSIMVYSNM